MKVLDGRVDGVSEWRVGIVEWREKFTRRVKVVKYTSQERVTARIKGCNHGNRRGEASCSKFLSARLADSSFYIRTVSLPALTFLWDCGLF